MFFYYLNLLDDALWAYVAIPAIVIMGGYFSSKLRLRQITDFKSTCVEFMACYKQDHDVKGGVNPVHAFFTTMGGCIGIGNIVAVCTAVKIGGPGALFWMWVTALIGMTVKYAEVYLSVQTRQSSPSGGYVGGPMYYLGESKNILGMTFAALLAIYGVEVYMFKTVTQSLVQTWHLPDYVVVSALLLFVLYAVQGGAKRVGVFCNALIPVFVGLYLIMSGWVLVQNAAALPGVLWMIVESAFQGHAPIGAFAGSGVMLALSQGVKRACYTGDIGVGYAGVISAEAHEAIEGQQARFAYLGIFLDTFVVCTLSVLLILVTDVWQLNMDESLMVSSVLSNYFPGVDYFMPVFIFLLGYSTIISFFHAGMCAMDYVMPTYGRKLYYLYAAIAFVTFAWLEAKHALALMNVCCACMLVINLIGLWRNRQLIR